MNNYNGDVFPPHSYHHSHSIWFVKNAQNIQTLLSNGYKKNTRTMDIGVTCSLVLKQLLVTIEELRKYCLFELWWCVKAKISCFCRTKLIQYFRPEKGKKDSRNSTSFVRVACTIRNYWFFKQTFNFLF